MSFLSAFSERFLHSKMKTERYPFPRSTSTQISNSCLTPPTVTTFRRSIRKFFLLYPGTPR